MAVDLCLAQDNRRNFQVRFKLQILIANLVAPVALLQDVVAFLELLDEFGGSASALSTHVKVFVAGFLVSFGAWALLHKLRHFLLIFNYLNHAPEVYSHTHESE